MADSADSGSSSAAAAARPPPAAPPAQGYEKVCSTCKAVIKLGSDFLLLDPTDISDWLGAQPSASFTHLPSLVRMAGAWHVGATLTSECPTREGERLAVDPYADRAIAIAPPDVRCHPTQRSSSLQLYREGRVR
jgi:hypothetical protein